MVLADVMDSFVARSKFMFEGSIFVWNWNDCTMCWSIVFFVLLQYKFMNRLWSLLEVSGAKIVSIDGFNLKSQVWFRVSMFYILVDIWTLKRNIHSTWSFSLVYCDVTYLVYYSESCWMYISFQSSDCGENDRVICVIPEQSSDDWFHKVGSLLRVNETGLISAILNGRLDPVMLKSPCGEYSCYLLDTCVNWLKLKSL